MTMTRATSVVLFATLCSFGCAGAAVSAGASDEGRARVALPQRTVAELRSSDAHATDAHASSPAPNDAVAESIPVEGSDLIRGQSTIKVQAPIDKVREGVVAFAQYPEFMPHYKKAKVLGRSASGGKDLYMEIEALNGAVTMWARVDVPKPKMINGVETYDAKLVDGNIKDFHAIWRLKKLDDATTELSLEVRLVPMLPLPDRIINSENLKGSTAGVVAMRARIEGK